MILDASTLPEGHVVRARVCVAGSGPAGMTLARALALRRIDVLLLEAGGPEPDDASQQLYAGRVEGDPYFELDLARLRCFGGTSGHWAGYCRPLDAHDFLPRADPPRPGWPIGRADLDPFLAAAAEILEIPDRFADRPVGSDLLRTVFHVSPPVRFGEKYRAFCAEDPHLRLCLRSAVVNLVPGAGGIRALEVVTEAGDGAQRRWQVEADDFVLALGGIENSRLLLWANATHGQALIPPATLGRYWMEHPTFSVAEAVVWRDPDGLFVNDQAFFALSPAALERSGGLNLSFDIDVMAYPDQTRALIADLMCAAPALGQAVMDAFGKNLVCGARVHAQCEQLPDAANRVALGEARDRLGLPRVVLHWRKSAADRAGVTRAVMALAEGFAAAGIGRLRLLDWVLDDRRPIPVDRVMASWHHMGGTRMGNSPADSVVDAQLRVHGLGNLHLAGSSVFPSGGYANPTLTIVQLSLRLADHLATRLAG